MRIVALILYIFLQIVLLPLSILGALIVAYKQLVVSKRLGVSQTAIEVINGRWTMHAFGMREDEATAKLAAKLPNTSLFGLWLALLPAWLTYKITGRYSFYPRVPQLGSENLADLVVARTLYFDKIIERVLGGVEQFVVMGAGYDTRAYGEFNGPGVKFFELDQGSVQQKKREALRSAGITSDHVTFVEVDFSKESAFDKLIESGFDVSKKTLCLLEGVTLYISEADVRKTMRELRENTAAGSVLLADIYAQRLTAIGKRKTGKKALEYTDEGFDFGLDFSKNHAEELREFVESTALAVGETFFLGETNKKGPFVVVVEMNCE